MRDPAFPVLAIIAESLPKGCLVAPANTRGGVKLRASVRRIPR
jgi:hypothetical protein